VKVLISCPAAAQCRGASAEQIVTTVPTTLMRIKVATSQDARFWKAFAAARARL
jgi:hypothetical protein